MRATEATFVAIDFEGTGAVDGYPNQPWQLGMARIVAGRSEADPVFNRLLHVPERPFNRHAPGRHAELREEMLTGPALPDLWPRVREWIGPPSAALVGHNVATEKRFLKDAFPLATIGPWVDTLALSRMAFPELASHRLEDVVRHVGRQERLDGLCPAAAYHDALYDAMASAVLLEYLLEQPGWEDVSVTALTQARPVRYHRHRAELRSRTSSDGTGLPG